VLPSDVSNVVDISFKYVKITNAPSLLFLLHFIEKILNYSTIS
jgi:hypothetical protein